MTKWFIIATLCYSSLYSAPAFSKHRNFVQQDGKTFAGEIKGDEYLNWIEADDGSILLYNKESKQYEYALIERDRLAPSGEGYREENTSATRSSLRKPRLEKSSLYQLWKSKRNAAIQRLHTPR